MRLEETKFENPYIPDKLHGVVLEGEAEAQDFVERLGVYVTRKAQFNEANPELHSITAGLIPVAGRMITELSQAVASGNIGSQTFLYESESRMTGAVMRGAMELDESDFRIANRPHISEASIFDSPFMLSKGDSSTEHFDKNLSGYFGKDLDGEYGYGKRSYVQDIIESDNSKLLKSPLA